MRQIILVLFALLVQTMNAFTQTPQQLAEIWDKSHITNKFPSDVRLADLKVYLEQLKKLGVPVTEVGRSFGNREIYQADFGHGPLKVFLWSQMHGNEPTATSAVVDMLAYFQSHRDKDWVKKIDEAMTIRVVPMLNPDGAEVYVRRNMQDIDINRDAIDLITPEARLLKKLRDDWSPAIGFNLHNQGVLTTAGKSANQATISLLIVYGDAAKTTNPGHERNMRAASAMIRALQQFIPGHIAQYSDEYTSTAFGDNFSAWGTPTILIETGGLYGKDEMYLVKLNFVAIVTALNSIATGSEANESTTPYLSLPENSSGGLIHFVFRRANVIDPLTSTPSGPFDITAEIERQRASLTAPVFIRGVTPQPTSIRGLEEYDASAFNAVQRFGRTKAGELAELLFYKKERVVDWKAADLQKQFPPDAIFSLGKWSKGEGVVPRIKY